MTESNNSSQSVENTSRLKGMEEIIRKFPEVIYVTDPQTHEVILVNDLFAEAIGEDPVGKKCYKAFQNLDEPCPFCTNDIIAKTNKPYTWEFHNQNLDRHYYISDQMIDWPDGRRVRFEVAIDITDKVKAENERNKFFDLSIDMVSISTTEGQFKQLNPAWEQALGWSLEELTSKPFVEFIHPDDLERTIDATKDSLEGDILNFQNRYQHKDGSFRWLSWVSRYDANEKLVYSIARDITDEREQAIALQERIKELNCLTEVSVLLAEADTDYDEAMQHIVDLIPKSWQVPERTSAKITVMGKTFSSANLKESPIRQTMKITLPGDNHPGVIEVFYDDQDGTIGPNPFLEEEEVLLKSIAREISKFIVRRRALFELLEHRNNLEKMVAERTADFEKANEQLEWEASESRRKAEIIKQQAEDILELSTPVMQVWDGVLLAPLIGNLDSRRAQNFMEVLLRSVAKENAQVAIIDITGVGIIDTETGRNVLETITAIGLLGAKVILTGVRATVAQTLVHLGVDLSTIETRSSLKSGLQLALAIRSNDNVNGMNKRNGR